MWERNLQDLIRGLRANKHDEARFIYSAIEEIRKEVRTEDMELKAAAVLKLAYVCLLMEAELFILKLVCRQGRVRRQLTATRNKVNPTTCENKKNT